MRRSLKRLVTIAFCSSLVSSCAIPLGTPRAQTSPTVAAFPAGTRPANEILLTPRDGPPVLGKLVGMLLPSSRAD